MNARLSAASLFLGAFAAFSASAQPYPSRPITLVAPAWSGTPTDTLARAIADGLSAKERLGQPVSVETRPGGRAFVGYAHVAQAPADGYILLVVTNQIALPKAIAPDRDFDRKAFDPVGRVAGSPYIIAVPAAVPVRTIEELRRHAARDPRAPRRCAWRDAQDTRRAGADREARAGSARAGAAGNGAAHRAGACAGGGSAAAVIARRVQIDGSCAFNAVRYIIAP